MSINISLNNLYSIISESLDKKEDVIIQVFGVSMYPFIHDQVDKIKIHYSDVFKKRDIVLFLKEDGFVVHRILKIKKGKYYIAGDNQTKLEIVELEQIKGIITEIITPKRTINVHEKKYRFNVYLWCFNLFIRRCILYILHHVFKKGLKSN